MMGFNKKLIYNKNFYDPVKNKRALKDKEASEYIGMSISWLRHGRITGDRLNHIFHPQFIKIGRSIRYLIFVLVFFTIGSLLVAT
jgi:hypothetical protein